jgi:Holliday junction resolvasome RuvABC endonuclease subunit
VLGLDAASTTGWAVVDGRNATPALLTWGAVDARTHHAAIAVVENARALGVAMAAVETPYVDKNADTAIKLGIVVGRWAQELGRAGIPWKGWKAQQWQFHVLKGMVGPGAPRAQLKAAAARWVKITYGYDVGEDEADAICFATWRAKQERFDELVRQRQRRAG